MVQFCAVLAVGGTIVWVSKAFFPVFFALAMIQRYLETFSRSRKKKGRISESWSFWLMTVVYIAVMLLALGEWAWREEAPRMGIAAVGLAMYGCGLALRFSARRALGDYWSVHVELHEHHSVVRRGPYRLIRHPGYLAMMLEVVGVPLVANAWFGTGVALFAYVPVVLLRLLMEERELIRKMGPEYQQFMSEVPMLIPFCRLRREKSGGNRSATSANGQRESRREP